ncbi:MAG TPA: four helix bundle protein [Sulfuricaulis sp.]|nr:four helix bundle protein [Sulfuricaulis sp.]
MPTLQSFQELEVWKSAREFVQEVYRITRVGSLSKDYALCNQMRRASISIMANIAEGFERDGNAEFIQFLSVAKASSGEVQALLFIALDQDYLSEPVFERLRNMSNRINRQIAGFIAYLRKSKIRGAKFK